MMTYSRDPQRGVAVRSPSNAAASTHLRAMAQGDLHHIRQLRSVLLWGGLLSVSTWAALIALIR